MAVTRKRIEANHAAIQDRIASACARRGRSPDEVKLVAVTKAVDVETVRHTLEAGLLDLGENRMPQVARRAEEIAAHIARRRTPLPGEPKWHMIGHLQRNKVRQLLPHVSLIHSVDSLRLAEEIAARAQQADRTVDVLLEVNCSEEPQKYGVAVGAAFHLGEMVASMGRLRLCGLMTMAAQDVDPEKARPTFVRLRELFEEMRGARIGGTAFRELSMGMSGDFEPAVEEGATIVRIGTALFA